MDESNRREPEKQAENNQINNKINNQILEENLDDVKENGQESDEKEKGRELYEWMQALVTSVLTVVLIFTFFIRMIGVDGHSMVPTLQHGDRLLVLTSLLYNNYKYGDIVIVRKDSFGVSPIVKRVIATGGQTVDIDFDAGEVYVDGEALDEPYIRQRTTRSEGMTFPLTVPEGSIFVMGDNRNESTDSRSTMLGTVDTRYVIGRAMILIFPGTDYYDESKRDFSRLGFLT